jgi:putative FmdB family regulatory protein
MPFYDFKCRKCGKSFTVFASIRDKDKTRCPECGSGDVIQEFKSINVGTSGGRSTCNTGFG